MVNYLIEHPTNTITMVILFDTTVAWLWQISLPHLQVPLRKGLGEGGVAGFY
jgi:hypothetical protein